MLSIGGDFHALSLTKQRLIEERRRREEQERVDAEAAAAAAATQEEAATLAKKAKGGSAAGGIGCRPSSFRRDIVPFTKNNVMATRDALVLEAIVGIFIIFRSIQR
mmetsp:Transcript_17273/g.31287  ORF Transcript_17273/g.31287 Transcript_17273/m.31287 type:complete len:106 (+) Transcript_17273:874-1191(+)